MSYIRGEELSARSLLLARSRSVSEQTLGRPSSWAFHCESPLARDPESHGGSWCNPSRKVRTDGTRNSMTACESLSTVPPISSRPSVPLPPASLAKYVAESRIKARTATAGHEGIVGRVLWAVEGKARARRAEKKFVARGSDKQCVPFQEYSDNQAQPLSLSLLHRLGQGGLALHHVGPPPQ